MKPPEVAAAGHLGEAPMRVRPRSCYDHLAGRVAVELASALERSRVIHARGERDYELDPEGSAWFEALGLDTAALQRSRRSFARRFVDSTERRPHLAGALGTALSSRLMALGWVARLPKTRALRITHRGAQQLEGRFGIVAQA